ncbi:MAG TPA: exodeoxyribonuclease VII large subunit [Candidatus Atribacteria bacterium]|nr:exodeoxyribonuclease VII large subunit [Candidatus Atribacteria bacterium]HPT77889.1 exodeoxyribonuclease VII large subunit [Candidatus Atribacteria bacterium]
MQDFIITVHQLNEYVRSLIARDPLLQQVKVRGEISNFKLHSSGHMYFSLKDEKARIQCVFFRQSNTGLKFIPKDGMRVLASGYVSIYTKDGQYQLYVNELQPDGIGELYLAFEALKRKLREEGLFDPGHKKPLPLLPSKIAVVTSNTGAAIRDIIKVARRRNKNIDILVIPVRVQGVEAPDQISKAIRYANTRSDIDLIIVGRGGGSIEELWAFNEEEVARAIWESNIPVISAVGHETDYTIADFVADVRAATPSVAAELAVPESIALQSQITGLRKALLEAILVNLNAKQHRLDVAGKSYIFKSPQLLLSQKIQLYDMLYQRFCSSVRSMLQKKSDLLEKHMTSLKALDPLNVLGRGFVYIVNAETGASIQSINSIKPSDRIRLCFKDGRADALIENLEVYQSCDNTKINNKR